MPGSYKLTYFNGRGRAEVSRMALVAAGQKFEDVRIDPAEWGKLKGDKERFPQGTMPVLEVEAGKTKFKLCQSCAVLRYLGAELNLYGKTNKDKALIDQIIDTCVDMTNPWGSLLFGGDENAKTEYKEKTLPKFLGILEDLVSKPGPQLTIADLQLFCAIEFVDGVKALDKFPKLKAHREAVAGNPRIAKYLSSRPETMF